MVNSKHMKQFKEHMQEKLAEALNQGAFPDRAILAQLTNDMLLHNPYNPPNGCPVDTLPDELIAQIFLWGLRIEQEEIPDEEDEEEDDMESSSDEMDLLEGDNEEWETDEDVSDVDEQVDVVPPPKSKKRSINTKDATPLDSDGPTPTPTPYEEDPATESEKPESTFPVLVSHVCRRWRAVSICTPALWTTLLLNYHTCLAQVVAYTERSKSLPMDIQWDLVAPDDWEDEGVPPPRPSGFPPAPSEPESTNLEDLASAAEEQYTPVLSEHEISCILDIIIPEVHRWGVFDVQASMYRSIFCILRRLSTAPSAPLLEALSFYHYDECDDFDTFKPVHFSEAFTLFSGSLPSLTSLAFWGVHIDWAPCMSFFSNLKELEMAYHARDIRPSYETFRSMVSSPALNMLSLCLSGPSGDPRLDWNEETIKLPQLQQLVLCHHEPEYIVPLYRALEVPNVHDLTVDFESGDYSDFAKALSSRGTGLSKSLLSQLKTLKIGALTCDQETITKVVEELNNLETFNLNCWGEEDFVLGLLEKKRAGEADASATGTSKMVYCPKLKSLWTIGADGKRILQIVKAREAGGSPLSTVMLSRFDEVETDDEEELRKRVSTFDYFQPSSDSEEDVLMIDEEDSSDEGW